MLRLNRFKLLLGLAAGFWAANGFAYQVWLGTHCAPSNAAVFLNSWSNTAARVTGFDANPTPCLPTAGDPDQNDTSCGVPQYNTVYQAFACQNLTSNIYCELDRIQISSNSVDYYASMTNVVQGRFNNAATYGFTFGSIMFYDDVAPYSWTASEVQQMRAYLDGAGRTSIGLMYDCRNDSQAVESWCTNSLVNDLVIEAGADLWFAGNGARTNLLRFLWTNSACAGKRIIFQMPTISSPPPYSQTNNFMVQRELLPWLATNIMGYDFLRSPKVIFMPVTYNGVTMTWIPEIATNDPGHYTNTITSLVLSLIEQRALFEGRTGVLPTQANAGSSVRTPLPAISTISNQTVAVNASTAALPFSLGSQAVPSASITVTGISSDPFLVPNSNVVISTWSSTDIGSVGVAGSNTLGDVITMQASGADVYGTADAGHFIYQPFPGDGSMVARVTNLQPVNVWSKAGLMIRVSTNAGSVNCFMHVSASNGVEFTWRQLNNGATSNRVVAGVQVPCWVSLTKTGTNFSGYYAPDNAGSPGTWAQVGSTVGISAMSSNLLCGLAGTSHNNSALCTAMFDNISGNSNRTVTVTPAANQSGVATITLLASDGWFTATNAFALTVPATGNSTPPTLGLLTNGVSLNENGAVTIPFTVGDAQTPASSLLVTGFSWNTNLIPNANLGLGGSGSNRTVTIMPVANQTGSTTISLAVSDGTLSAAGSVLLTVMPPSGVFTAVTYGTLEGTETWSAPPPVSGDTNIWQTGYFLLGMDSGTETFYGNTLVVQTGGEFDPGLPGATLTLSNLVLDGGTIYMGNNLGLTMNLSGRTFTLNRGTLQAGGSNNGRNVIFQNGSLAGSGAINITGVDTTGSEVEFQSSINTAGFTGVFAVSDYGILRLPAIAATNATFGLNLSGSGTFYNDTAVALTSLVMNGTNIPPGTYAYGSFTPAQQAFLGNNGGTITVANTAPTLEPIANQTLIAGQTLMLTNVAADPNVPPQTLTFSLLVSPNGAAINTNTGVFSWRPTIAQSPSTNPVCVEVANNGMPPLAATQSFVVMVIQPIKPTLTNVVVSSRQFSFTVGGNSGPDYAILISTNLTSWLALGTNFSATPPFTFTDPDITNFNRRFYRVLLGP